MPGVPHVFAENVVPGLCEPGIVSPTLATDPGVALTGDGSSMGRVRLPDALTQRRGAAGLVPSHDERSRTPGDWFVGPLHDLRSSLSAVTGWIEVLKRVGNDMTKRTAALAALERNVKAVIRLVEQLEGAGAIVERPPVEHQ